MSEAGTHVEEVQGLYGPFHFPELLLQKIWAEQSFNRQDLRTESGEPIKLIKAGRWNRRGGPDFQQAEIEIGGEVHHGHVELHLYEHDWRTHQHVSDSAYDDVVLHVVLFPGRQKTSRGAGGRHIPILVLLPHLWHDLEEYAADAAVSAIAQWPADLVAQVWLELSPSECRSRILAEARGRWRGKVHYARQRIKKLGWQSACHHNALEILGYRFNRTPMLAVATAWPLPEWTNGRVDLEQVWLSQTERWHLAAVRPANHPRRRLAAYAAWIQTGGDWPERLRTAGEKWPPISDNLAPGSDIAELRRGLAMKHQWQTVMEYLGAAPAIARPRADNLWGDGLLPLLAAAGFLEEATAFLWWYAGWPGDQAARLAQAAKLAGIADGRRNPLAWGHVQGLIGQQLAVAAPPGRGT